MRVGMTYDLRQDYLDQGLSELETAECDHPSTILAIEAELRAQGHEPVRLGNLRQLVARLAAGERWDLVFNIAEGLYGYAREAQVPALLDAYRIPYVFSDALVLAVTLHKGVTKHIVRDLGIPTPEFAVVEPDGEVAAAARLGFPLFVKPVAEGTGKGIDAKSKVGDLEQLRQACQGIWQDCRQAALVETFLPGREFTVGIVGSGSQAEAIGAMEILIRPTASLNDVYSYSNKEHFEGLVDYRRAEGAVAEAAIATSLAAWRGLGCRDGGRVDIRLDAAGTAHFLEVNPLAGLRPGHSDLPLLCDLCGISYRELLARIMASACRRLGQEGN